MIDEIPCPVCARPSMSRGTESSALGRLRGAFVFDRACTRCGVAFTVNLPTILYGRLFPLNRSATVIRPLNDELRAPPPQDDGWFEMDLHPAFLNTPHTDTLNPQSREAGADPEVSAVGPANNKVVSHEPFQFDLKMGTFRVSLRGDATLPSVPPWIISSVRSMVHLAGSLLLLIVPRLRDLLEAPQYRPVRKPLRFRSEALLGVSIPSETANRPPKKSSGTR